MTPDRPSLKGEIPWAPGDDPDSTSIMDSPGQHNDEKDDGH
jgi:hypothetical protein